jgi:hypothetical protein
VRSLKKLSSCGSMLVPAMVERDWQRWAQGASDASLSFLGPLEVSKATTVATRRIRDQGGGDRHEVLVGIESSPGGECKSRIRRADESVDGKAKSGVGVGNKGRAVQSRAQPGITERCEITIRNAQKGAAKQR